MFFVYVLQNKHGLHYTGQTEDIASRLRMHNNTDPDKARFHRYTYLKGPWKLFFKKSFKTRALAKKFESFLKTGKGRDWLRENILN